MKTNNFLAPCLLRDSENEELVINNKGNISVFIVVFKFVMHFCYRRTIGLYQENFSYNNKTNCTRRHKFITHKTNAARSSQVAVMTSHCS